MEARRPHVRPQFEITTDLSGAVLVERARTALGKSDEVDGICTDTRIEMFTTDGSRFFWSPQLTVEIGAVEIGAVEIGAVDNQSRLRCRFGPHPNIWTLYVAIHGFGALTTLAAAIYGLSQHLSGQTPWALWALPAAPILAVLVWAMAFVGQSMGHEQMNQLRRFLDDLL